MAVWERELELNSGIRTEGYGERIAYMKNLIKGNGALIKRNGHRVLYRFISEELLPMRINGIFTYGDYLIIHAENSLYKCTRDLSSVEPILMDNIALANEKSSAFSLDGRLFIECNGAYVYDGVSLNYLGEQKDIYIPKTRVGIRNTKSGIEGTDYEKPNLLTPKRINTLLGEANDDRVSSFMLDSEPIKGSEADVVIKIRLKHKPTENEEASIESTSYTGVDSDGNDIEGVAIIKYHIKSYGKGNVYRISEPICDENGNEISIKTADGMVYTYKTITWTLQIVGKELRLNMELIPPYPNEDNIEVSFSSNEIKALSNVKNMSAISGKGGESLLALCFDDGVIYYTAKKSSCGYLPSDNQITVGTSSTKIQRLISLQNGYIGVFTNDGFYKIGMPSESEGVSAYKTGDGLLLSSSSAVACLGNEVLVLAGDGIYSIRSLSGYQDMGIYLEKRSKAIDSLISSFVGSERENSHMVTLGDMLYLFIGDKALVTGKELVKKDNAYAVEQYQWYLFDNMRVRCATGVDSTLYMGREDGTIATFYDGFYDLEERELFYDKLELSTIKLDGKTAIFTPYLSWVENADLVSGKFDVKIGNATCNGSIAVIERNDLFFDDYSIRVYENQQVSLYKDGIKVYSGAILGIEPTKCALTLDFSCEDGEYQLYISDERVEYEIVRMNDSFLIKDKEKYLEIEGLEKIKISKKRDILASIIVNGIALSREGRLKMVDYVSIKPTSDTSGNIKIFVDGQRGRKESELNIAGAFDFGRVDMDKFGLEKQFDRVYKVPTMLLTDCYIGLKIEAFGKAPFGIEGVKIGWKGEK